MTPTAPSAERYRNWSSLRTVLHAVLALEILALLGGGALAISDELDERAARTERERVAAEIAAGPPSTAPPRVLVNEVAPLVCQGTGSEGFASRALDGTPRRAWFEGAPGLLNGVADGQQVPASNYDTVVCTTTRQTVGDTCPYSRWGVTTEFNLTMTGSTISATVRDARSGLEVGRFTLEFPPKPCPSVASRDHPTGTDIDWTKVTASAAPFMTK